MEVNSWTNCYEGSWKDQIVPEAFSHPAKMAYGLLLRILTHAEDQGWLAPESIILDPFGGISTTGILAAYRGYQCITCELEPKFTNLAMQNVKLHLAKWNKLKSPVPVIIQGDSRQLCSLVESADLIVSSPPYTKDGLGHTSRKCSEIDKKKRLYGAMAGNQYGQMEGNLGNMKPGKVDVVISSPPFADMNKGDNSENQTKKESVDWRTTPGGSMGQSQRRQGYGTSTGNLGNLKAGDVDCVISSPPFSERQPPANIDFKNLSKTPVDKYGKTKGNLQHLKAGDVSLILSSPPYEGTEIAAGKQSDIQDRKQRRKDKSWEGYNKQNKTNLGSNKGDTFWQAAKEILEQCFQILRPGGHAIFVCKDFVRKGKRVTFSDDWQRLCESVGFTLCCRHRAMLVKEEVHPGLFGADITKTTERKSFFRRLAEAKGSPRIDHEDVICMFR